MYNQLCLIRDFQIGEDQAENFESVILKKFGVRVKYHYEIKTLPDIDDDGLPIPGTGGRNDLFFYVHEKDVEKFAVSRMHLGIRWWEDVIKCESNKDSYPPSFVLVHPPIW